MSFLTYTKLAWTTPRGLVFRVVVLEEHSGVVSHWYDHSKTNNLKASMQELMIIAPTGRVTLSYQSTILERE